MNGQALFLCDMSGIAAQPWAEAGCECWCVDIQHSIRRPRTVQRGAGTIHFIWGDVRNFRPPEGLEPRRLVFGAAMTPCTHVAGSGARDFRTKGGAMLRDAIEMFDAAGVILAWSGAPYYRENPVGYFSSIPHIGKPDHGKPRPLLVDYVGDRDLWRFKLPMSRDVNAFVFAHEYSFDNWDHLDRQLHNHMDVQRVAEMGGAIEKKHHKDVAELVGVMRREMILGGHWVPVANIPYTLTSDAGHLMCEPYPSPNLQGDIVTPPFAACYWDTPEGRVFSLRSRDDGADVSAIAKGYGGGGHARAAGFRMPIGWEGDARAEGRSP